MSTVSLPTMKRGDSFSLPCRYKENGTATTVAGFTITAQVRTSQGVKLTDLTVTKADQGTSPGVFVLDVPEGQNPPDWPVDELRCDIQFVDGAGLVRSTQTFLIPVEQDETYA